jgi:hypothetical protein
MATARHVRPPRRPSRGHSVQGEVKNYVPVTDAMLRNPPAGDWLMARRNYRRGATVRSTRSRKTT